MNNEIINSEAWLPYYTHHQEHIYILLTSLNLGGAEKIVSDQLWANFYQKAPNKITLIVIYDKEKEHSIPPNVNVIRLNNNLENGTLLFKQIAYENKPLVCHLINDSMAHFLFSFNLKIHIVIHNDKRGWSNTKSVFDNPQVLSLISVCNHVTKQLNKETNKTVFTVRHQINPTQFKFNIEKREIFRKILNLSNDDILIGMTGRICLQKNYFLALDVIYNLIQTNPNYKLIILGGFEKANINIYFDLLKKITLLKIQKNVFLPGFQNNAFEWINAFDIAMNVSHFEGLSMATQELIMNGLPMVLSDVCGQKEILDFNNQLNFFNIPESLNHPDSQKYNMLSNDENELNLEYKKLVNNISDKILNTEIKRFEIINNKEIYSKINWVQYGSHNLWSLFNFINETKTDVIKPAFLTSNLNLGGAQRSLVNLLIEFKSNDINIPLIMLNQSNYTGFYKKILDNKIEHFLAHEHIDVFLIMTNLLNYIHKNKINRIILWNVDSKVKLLLSKLTSHFIDIIDVSPGDYCFNELDNEILFQEAIYYKKEQYFSSLYKFVSKFDNSNIDHPYKTFLKNPTEIIPNGVPINQQLVNNKSILEFNLKNPFKFLVCGRITENKHIHIILKSFRDIYTKYPYTTIDFYGSVENYNLDYYEELINEYKDLIDLNVIKFHGNIDDPITIMKDYHSIIVLGTHQGSPNVVLEACSVNLPCIANDSGGTKEIINDNTGILLDSIPNSDKLLIAMDYTINNYEDVLKKSFTALNFIKTNFSMELMKNKYENLIFDIKK